MNEMGKELTLEMIPEGLCRDIAEAIGTENLVKLTELIGGSTSYIPLTKNLLSPVRDERIRAEFNGYNYFELAQKYGVTERWVRILCGKGNVKGQMNLFDI